MVNEGGDFLTLNEFLYQVLPLLLSVLTSATSLLITIIRTRQKAITHKVEKSCDLSSANNKAIDLSQFVVEFQGKEYLLSELKIKRR